MTDARSGRPLALTRGDPAGIGGDITLMAWRRRDPETPCFFVVDDPPRLAEGAASEGEVLGYYRRVRDEICAFIEKLPGALSA